MYGKTPQENRRQNEGNGWGVNDDADHADGKSVDASIDDAHPDCHEVVVLDDDQVKQPMVMAH